jgi:hypothetical protein
MKVLSNEAAELTSWLSGMSDDTLQRGIIAQRRIISSLRASQGARALANELLTALHREAGQRVAKIYQLRSLNS